MIKVRLKQFRVRAGLTQAQIAAAVGVTQPNYQRWESGAAPMPDIKLQKLAEVLKTNPNTLLGRHQPIETSLYGDSVDSKLRYYGEVAIHFSGGGEPLLLSISEDGFTNLHRDLQTNTAYIAVESLANQTVMIRTRAISDVYFSSESYDDYGPEHDAYVNHVDLQIPDARDWEIIECIGSDENDIENFDPADVERVRNMVMITDEQYESLLADGLIEFEDLEKERARNQSNTDRILNLARMSMYQLSTGRRRSVYVNDPKILFYFFYEVVDFADSTYADDIIRLEAEGRHRTIFINKAAVDYVIIPTHQLEKGRVEANAEALES